MKGIDPDIRENHDLRSNEGKAAAKKEQAERDKEQAKREKERAKREKEQAKEQAKIDAYKKWAKKNNWLHIIQSIPPWLIDFVAIKVSGIYLWLYTLYVPLALSISLIDKAVM